MVKLNFPAKRYPSKLNFCLILLSAIISITPEFGKIIPNSVDVGLIIIWYLDVLLLENNKFYGIERNFILVIGLWLLYEFSQLLFGLSHASIGNYFIKISFFDVVIKSTYVAKFYSIKQKSLFLRLLQISIILNVCYNIYVSIIFPEVYLLSDENRMELIGFNIPTAVFYNMLAFFIGICFVDLYRCRKLIFRLIDIFGIFVSYYFMLTCEPRATSLTFSILILAAAWVIYSKNKNNTLLIIFVLGTVLLTVLLNIEYIISLLPDRISIRYYAVLGMNGGEENTLGRLDLMLNSLYSFITHPIFGVGYYADKAYTNIIGQHAIIPDFLGCFGIIGLIFLIFFLKNIKLLIVNNIKDSNYHKYATIIYWIFILYSFNSNTFYPSVAVSAFLLLSCENNKISKLQNIK